MEKEKGSRAEIVTELEIFDSTQEFIKVKFEARWKRWRGAHT